MSNRPSRDAVTEEQPPVAPVDFEEWATALRGGLWRTLVVGFAHRCRLEGKLRQKRTPAEWQAAFEAFVDAPVGGTQA